MANVDKLVAGGAVFSELVAFVEECKAKKIPANAPIKICQHSEKVESDILDMKADDSGIIFYDWI